MGESIRTRIDVEVRGGDEAERAAAALDKLVALGEEAVSASDVLTISRARL